MPLHPGRYLKGFTLLGTGGGGSRNSASEPVNKDIAIRDDHVVSDGVGKVLEVRRQNGERRRLEGKAKTP
jgi:hypothetical protein